MKSLWGRIKSSKEAMKIDNAMEIDKALEETIKKINENQAKPSLEKNFEVNTLLISVIQTLNKDNKLLASNLTNISEDVQELATSVRELAKSVENLRNQPPIPPPPPPPPLPPPPPQSGRIALPPPSPLPPPSNPPLVAEQTAALPPSKPSNTWLDELKERQKKMNKAQAEAAETELTAGGSKRKSRRHVRKYSRKHVRKYSKRH